MPLENADIVPRDVGPIVVETLWGAGKQYQERLSLTI